MALSVKPLELAFTSLCRAVARFEQDRTDLEVRDACIQRFEYTYELSIKIIKRYLEQEMSLAERIDQLNYRDLIRIAHEVNLIKEVTSWFVYREARNQTSHTYDEKKAAEVYSVIQPFIVDTQELLNTLADRLEKT